jgi:hypothetical protein
MPMYGDVTDMAGVGRSCRGARMGPIATLRQSGAYAMAAIEGPDHVVIVR